MSGITLDLDVEHVTQLCHGRIEVSRRLFFPRLEVVQRAFEVGSHSFASLPRELDTRSLLAQHRSVSKQRIADESIENAVRIRLLRVEQSIRIGHEIGIITHRQIGLS